MANNTLAFILVMAISWLPSGLGMAEEGAKAQPSSAAPLSSSDLMQSLEAYKKASMANDVDGILSLVYPAVFRLLPKEKLKVLMSEMYASKTAPVITAIDYIEIGAPQGYSKGLFSLVKYHIKLELPHPGDATPAMNKDMVRLLKNRMGPEAEVSIDEKRGRILISKPSMLIALREGQAGWTVLDRQNADRCKKAGLLPGDLLEKLPDIRSPKD